MRASLDQERLCRLVERLTGMVVPKGARQSLVTANVGRRLRAVGAPDLESYLSLVLADDAEYAEFISAVTIHTTAWFREAPHFARFAEFLRPGDRPFRLWSCAASSGEEAYSFALALEHYRQANPGFEYEVLGTDIDPLSIRKATAALYPASALGDIPAPMRGGVLLGSGPSEGLLTLSRAIRERCRFEVADLTSFEPSGGQAFDWIVCRNVLIYFVQERIEQITKRFARLLAPGGRLCLGHSEAVDHGRLGLSAFGNSLYGLSARSEGEAAPSGGQGGVKPRLIMIGASTGGPEALDRLLHRMPIDGPPVVVVQHLPATFAPAFSRRLAERSGLALGNVRDGAALENGHLYVAQGDYHLRVRGSGGANGRLLLSINQDAPAQGHRPSIDVLFSSATPAASGCIAVLLTGMGKDGAQGLFALRQAGAYTLVQDEHSSVVFGMPGEAVRLGAACDMGDLARIRARIDQRLAGGGTRGPSRRAG
jgi:chemotaxis response regulator CheB